jgi:hypothetical protein
MTGRRNPIEILNGSTGYSFYPLGVQIKGAVEKVEIH